MSVQTPQLQWTSYIKPTDKANLAYGTCVFGDYIAVVGRVGWEHRKHFVEVGYAYVALLDKVSGRKVKEWIGEVGSSFYNCVSVGDRLYVIGKRFNEQTSTSNAVLYMFDASLLPRMEYDARISSYHSIAYDGSYIYIGSQSSLIVEKRSLDGALVVSKLAGGILGKINDIGVDPATGRIWAVGSKGTIFSYHSLAVVLDGELREVARMEYPIGRESYLGSLYSVCFDGRGYAFISGDLGVAKFSSRGELVAINKDIGGIYKLACVGDKVYAFRVQEIEGYKRHVLTVCDSNLEVVREVVLSKNVNADSWFESSGKPSFDGSNLYVAGHDGDYRRDRNMRIVVYSIAVTPPRPAAPAPAVAVVASSLADLERLLSSHVSGLVKGYGCLGSYRSIRISLPRGIAPEGFEGEWSCCLLGCGGWGCAYRCERAGVEPFVLKVPRGLESIVESGDIPTVSSKVLERVLEEASLLKALSHPNILRLYGASRVAPILAYEYADHGSLGWQTSKGWKPSLKDAILIAIQVGDALRYIHSRGLVHGDVKAGNVFLAGGVAKLGDFSSLVKLLATTSHQSRFAYTLGWRAPEQVYSDYRKKAREMGLEQRIDVYQLGDLLLYLLTGESLDGEDAVEEGRVKEAVGSVENEEIKRLLVEALQPEPWNRVSSEELVRKLLKIYTAL